MLYSSMKIKRQERMEANRMASCFPTAKALTYTDEYGDKIPLLQVSTT